METHNDGLRQSWSTGPKTMPGVRLQDVLGPHSHDHLALSGGVFHPPKSALRAGPLAALSKAASASQVARAQARRIRNTRGVDNPDAFRAHLLRETAGQICSQHGVSIRVYGHWPTDASIFVANQQSYIDPLVLSALRPVMVIVADHLKEVPFVGEALHTHGVVFVEENDPQSGVAALHRARRALARGVSVLCFPGGLSPQGEEPRAFRRGVFGLARLLGAPVVPMRINYDTPLASWLPGVPLLGHYRRLAAEKSHTVTVVAGDAIETSPFVKTEILRSRAHTAVRALPTDPTVSRLAR